MTRSWISRVIVLLATILLVLSMFLAWTNLNYNAHIRSTMMRENTNTVTIWSNGVETQLNAIYEHIYDLLLTIYNNTQLGEGTPMMRIETQIRCLDMMQDKLIVSSYACCFFVRDTDSDLFLFSARSGMSNREVSSLKAFARTDSQESVSTLNSKKWRLETIDGQSYFVKNISLGKYVVGVASSLAYYDIENFFPVLGEAYSCMLASGETIYLCSGEDWSEDLSFQDGVPEFNDARSVVTVSLSVADASVILAVRTGILMDSVSSSSTVLLLLSSVVCLGLVIYLVVFLQTQVLQPTRVLLQANQEIGSGNISYRINQPARSREFAELYDSFNNMANQIHKLRIASYDHLLQEQENRLRMLRAQIKPHFYLNAITTITNMTYQNHPEQIRAYITSLAKYLRYMMNTQSEWTTVENELSHIRNYLQMQELRFPGSIREEISCTPEAAGASLPMLTLFTLVENSLKHAMTLYEPLRLIVRCETVQEENFTGLRIVEEDSGDGFSQSVLDMMSSDNAPQLTKDHLGLNNVRYTLNLIYHRNDLLRLSNREGGGAHVEIWIPKENNHEAADL